MISSPGRQLSNEAPPGIVPDGIVEYDGDNDRYIAYLNDRRLPNLRLNQEYALLAKDKAAPKQTREFIKTNMGNIPERLWNSAVSDNPHIAHTETWYFKS